MSRSLLLLLSSLSCPRPLESQSGPDRLGLPLRALSKSLLTPARLPFPRCPPRSQKLAQLLANFDKRRRNDRRLKFQAIVSHGEKLAKTYQQQVSKVFEQAELEM